MLKQIRPAISVLVMITLLTGVAYPLAVTGVAQLVFPRQANGSLLEQKREAVGSEVIGSEAIGSELIGQSFSEAKYFWGRLSATSPHPYNAAASSGSNFGPLHPGLVEAAESRISQLSQASGVESNLIPVDLVTASASGLDPHISPAAAEFQVSRVAKARGLDPLVVRKMIQQHQQSAQWGLWGEARVHVLRLNLALDELQSQN